MIWKDLDKVFRLDNQRRRIRVSRSQYLRQASQRRENVSAQAIIDGEVSGGAVPHGHSATHDVLLRTCFKQGSDCWQQ
jgi:hypothetical protein